MNLSTIHEHTIDLDLLTGGVVIDAGCRGFQFSEALRDFGCKVKAFDVERLEVPTGIEFQDVAIGDTYADVYFVSPNDKNATFIVPEQHGNHHKAKPVRMIDLNDYMEVIHGNIDVLKLDIEGYEYFILDKLKPIPRQLSIEFHEHCFPGLHGAAFESCMGNILKYYYPVQHERYSAHGSGFNYWDSLFVKKSIVNGIE